MNFSSQRKRRTVAEINLTPLLDMVFNLLVFFLITTTFVQNPGIDVDLPKASSTASDTEAESVIIAITAEGRLIHEGKAVAKDELKLRLQEHFKQRQEATVILQADSKTPHGTVVEIMDMARQIGFAHLAIATEAE